MRKEFRNKHEDLEGYQLERKDTCAFSEYMVFSPRSRKGKPDLSLGDMEIIEVETFAGFN